MINDTEREKLCLAEKREKRRRLIATSLRKGVVLTGTRRESGIRANSL